MPAPHSDGMPTVKIDFSASLRLGGEEFSALATDYAAGLPA